jgi:hypothetical protein
MAKEGIIIRHPIRCDQCGRMMYLETPVRMLGHENLYYRLYWYRCHNCKNEAFVRLNQNGKVVRVLYGNGDKTKRLYYGKA